MKRTTLILASTLFSASLFASGCASKSHGPDIPKAEPQALEAAKNPVNIFDADLKKKIASDLYRNEVLEDGRMKIAVNLRNRTKKPLHVQVRAVFKDISGISTGDESAWQDLYLVPQQASTFTTTSRDKGAVLATVEVRKP
ncbi:hypothetical protein BH09SUM1_BH09SUM1_30210 [soil metagenome]